jgi:hypothetical protein
MGNTDKIQAYKTMRYGKIAIQLRRGLIDASEADHYFDEAERDCQALQAACENPAVRDIILKGLSD